MELPVYVTKLLNKLNDAGYEAYVVGGAIRNELLGLPVHDYDLTTNALPQQIKDVFSDMHTIDTGIKHGTVCVISDHHMVEITTYRKDVDYVDHRHPSEVVFATSLRADCERRDFTINAMCYHPSEGIIDYFNGQDDLKHKLIRCIGEPERRFEEDALRILRALRFAARLSFAIDGETSRVLRAKRDTLTYVSIERITSEFNGILESKNCGTIMADYREVFTVFIPELTRLEEKTYKEMCENIEEESSGIKEVRLAYILYSLNDMNLARKILRRMKYSNNFISSCIDLLNTANDPIDTDIEFRQVLAKLKGDINNFFAFRKLLEPGISLVSKRAQYAKLTNDDYCWQMSDLDLSGKDLIDLGYKGKDLGLKMSAILKAIINEEIINDKDTIIAYIKKGSV